MTNDYKIWQVIGASSVGTMIEWYDFYIFGSLATVIAPLFYPPGNNTLALIAYLSTFAVGYLARRTEDPLLPNVGGMVLDATLAWQATAATSVALLARTQASETVIAGNSAILSRDAIVQVEHRFEPYLTGTVRAGFGFDQYVGLPRVDDRYSVAAAMLYKLSRQLQLKAELRQEWTRSNEAVNNFAATVGLIGVRLQY